MDNCSRKNVAIPLHVRLVESKVFDQRHHRLEFGVLGVDFPAAVRFSGGFCEDKLAIEYRECRGNIDLPDHLVDSLAVACFKVISGYICDYDGQSGTWTSRDCSSWLRRQFAAGDAAQIENALRLQVTPGLEGTDQVVVADDDAVLADDCR